MMQTPTQTLPSGAVIRSLTEVRPVNPVNPTNTGNTVNPLNTMATPATSTSPKKQRKNTTTTTRSPQKKQPQQAREEEEEDQELQVLTTRLSLNDIISKQRMVKCVKSQKCTHTQAFDFDSFCRVNDIQMDFYDRLDLVESRYKYVPLRFDDNDGDGADNGIKRAKDVNEKKRSRESSLEIIKQRFKLELRTGKASTNTGNLKLTKKRKNAKVYKCPVCNSKFSSTELIHDDFMAMVLMHVPPGVETVEIDDDNVVTVLETKQPYEVAQDVISLSDGEDDDTNSEDLVMVTADGKAVPRGPKKKKIKIITDEDDPYHLSEFFDTDESGDEYFAVEGTADDPVVID